MTNKLNNFISKIRDFCKNINISIKYIFLLLITVISLFLILLRLNGLDFGIIALICWTFAFLDLSRIKIKDFEIEFMSHKQAITSDERKLYLENYHLMEKFMFEFDKMLQVDSKTLDYISKATREAYLFLNLKLAKKLDEYCVSAKHLYILDKKIERLEKSDQDTSECIVDRNSYLNKLHDINLVELYRPYVKVKDDEE